ncbi:hypothetical protein PHMEG_00034291 [Phytophthora megakarya]|uniref:Uncharacterized protein n=1 Tax=Phytophthora megakarya TaxID=4795 RepID=A0A225URX5_9STRA|nr:hypothetical protein PHMEG_00034291 [Phytophthora megakarya]
MKNEQDGSRPRDPRNVYANPIIPEICPVLGFGIYFAVLVFSQDGKLFPGGNQYSRFKKILKSVLDDEKMQKKLEEVGLRTNDFGTNSARCVGSPPLRRLTKHDMSTRLKNVRLAELQRLMRCIEALLSADEILRAYGCLSAVGLLFEQVKNRFRSKQIPTSEEHVA